MKIAFPQDGLRRLAERVVAGEVVFFVGSGFSVDSEGNTTARLTGRLLARFDALTGLLAGRCLECPTDLAVRARKLRAGLTATFPLSESADGYLTTPSHVAVLAREYYVANDWMTSAFALILQEIRNSTALDRERLLFLLEGREHALLTDQLGEKPPHFSRLAADDLQRLLALPPAAAGKALFLETVGFADKKCMSGEPCTLDISAVEKSYYQRLKPRHNVLAWLAREGLTPVLLTTNFDLLVEGAYRLAGLTPEFPIGKRLSPATLPQRLPGAPPASFDAFRRITSATEFFGRGGDHRSASLLKIHGCAEGYRWARQKGWEEAYLPSIVFTFREIQNWREDSWSRDMVSTLLRTRTMVFCGYSGADPVLHDTIRTVYEEMAHRRGRLGTVTRAETKEKAPAFYFGGADKIEFHGMEILRAASRAVGDDPGLTEHPNYLRFQFIPEEGEGEFPNIDEEMRWLFLLIFRRRQAQALEGNLGRLATVLLGHPCPETERTAVLKEFKALCDAEEAITTSWKGDLENRTQFERMVGWVENFQVQLLREYSLAEASLRFARPGLELEQLRRSNWYFPALDHADWAAWGAVVELALRKRIAAWQKLQDWKQDQPWISTAAGNQATVLYSRGATRPTPDCLTIRLASPGGSTRNGAVRGVCRRHRVWEINSSEIPWQRKGKGDTPGAAKLWEWAHQPFNRIARGPF